MTPPLVAISPNLLLAAAGVLAAALAGTLAWLAFGRLPRRARAYRRGRAWLAEGRWEDALAAVRELLKLGRLPPRWEGRVRGLQGECQRAAGDQALAERRYEDALHHYDTAAELLALDARTRADRADRVHDAMLDEALSRFAQGPAHTEAARDLLTRRLAARPADPAAVFWLGLCHLRDNQPDRAAEAFLTAHDSGQRTYLDPPLYLGMVRLRQGRPQDALRHLAEANRIDAACPFIPLHVGQALVAAGGDLSLAVRALQKSLRALEPHVRTPQRAWAETLPEGLSFIRRLAGHDRYVCPILGPDLGPALAQARLALAQAQARLGRHQEAADLYARVLQDVPPTAAVLRGHGVALARLGRHDEAYKQLRLALDLDPKDVLAGGYLALTAALGKPPREQDRASNVAWAVRQLARPEVYGNPEWADLVRRVLAEVRTLGIDVPVEEQVRLCDVLASVFATDPSAAAAYAHLAATHPDALRPEHAWMYCRAAQEHGLAEPGDLALFDRAFADAPAARAFFAQRGWDFDDLEGLYLERCATARPGRFPDALGPDAPARGAVLLLDRARGREQAGDLAAAARAAEALLRLAPTDARAHDHLARLHHARGNLDGALALLAGWARLRPDDPLPLLRRAVLEQQRDRPEARAAAVAGALALTAGPRRAAAAFLGARLALRAGLRQAQNADGLLPPWETARPALEEAAGLLVASLRDDPARPEPLALLAAVRVALDDAAGLAALADALVRPEVPDARFHFLAAAALLAAGRPADALAACRRAWGDLALIAECRYLMGRAHLALGDEAAAVREWEIVARDPDSPSAPWARAELGRLHLARGRPAEALAWWADLDPVLRQSWGLDEPIRAAAVRAGLDALDTNRPDAAADHFRAAQRLGLHDDRLGPLAALALVRAARQRLDAAGPLAGEPLAPDNGTDSGADIGAGNGTADEPTGSPRGRSGEITPQPSP